MKYGLIGIGLIGRPLAEKIMEANYSLNIYNRTKSKLVDLKIKDGNVYSNIVKIVKDSDTVLLMLSDNDAINEVLFNSNIGNYEGKTIIQMGTIAPEESLEIGRRVTKMGGNYFEAPVLGSIPQIKNGELIVLVGGDIEYYNRWKSFFSVFSNKVLHIGKVGDASAMKLALNQLIISETVAFSMSIGYLREKKINTETFMQILRGSALYAPTFDKKLPNMLERNFENPNFPLKHLLKDLDLILGEFGENDINASSLKGARKVLLDAIELGLAENDYSALYNSIHKFKK